MLIAFEGVDQSGKETQAQRLRERLREAGHKVRLLSFPDYGTSIGEEIARALQGEREYGPTSCSCCLSPTGTNGGKRFASGSRAG